MISKKVIEKVVVKEQERKKEDKSQKKADSVLERRQSDGNVKFWDDYEVPIIGKRHS